MNYTNLFWASACLSACVQTASADDRLVNFSIPPQSAATALDALAKQSDLQMLFSREALKNTTTQGLTGKYTARDALKKLLNGTGLTYNFTAADAVAIKPVVEQLNKTEQTTLKPVTVTAEKFVEADLPDSYTYTHSSIAMKTDTPLMETPVNIQIIPQQVIRDQLSTTLDRTLQNVSGVRANAYSGYGEESITIRGFETNTVYIDGFRMIEYGGFGLRNISNAQSVEVMKGAAAVMYGASEPGGIVNITTKQPQADQYYSVSQSFGSWNHFLTNVDATGAVNKNKSLMYRMNINYDTSDSWRSMDFNRKLIVAPSFKWQLSPKTQMNLKFEYTNNPYSNDNAQVIPYFNSHFVPLNTAQNLMTPYSITLTNERERTLFNWSHDFNDDWKIKQQIVTNFVKNWGNNGNIASFQYDANNNLTASQSPYGDPISKDETDATSIDLTGHFNTYGAKHTLLVGSDFYHVYNGGTFTIPDNFNSSTINVNNPYGSAINTVAVNPNNFYKNAIMTNSLGVYAQDQIKLFDQVHFLLGGRYQNVNQTNWTIVSPAFGGDGTSKVWGTPLNDSAITPRFGLLWQTTHWLSLYAHYSGGFAANQGQDYLGNPLKASHAIDKEAGFKTQFFGGLLQASASYFDLTKTNIPVCDPVHSPSGCGGLAVFQKTIGAVNSRGVEVDLQGELTPGWNMIMNYAYTNARISESTNDPAQTSTYLLGQRMPATPFNMGSFWSTYNFGQTGNGWTVGSGVSVRGSSLDATNTIQTGGYATWNLMTKYQTKVGGFKVSGQLNVDNILDKQYLNIAQWSSGSYGNVVPVAYSTPRSFMGTLRVEF
ncbi:MAG: TonB-dependent receptor [Methylococcales bacterium]